MTEDMNHLGRFAQHWPYTLCYIAVCVTIILGILVYNLTVD